MESIGKHDTKQLEAYLNALDLEKMRITQEGIQVKRVKSYLNGEYIGIYRVYVTWMELYLGRFPKALYQASLCRLVDLLQSSTMRKLSSCLMTDFKQFLTSAKNKQGGVKKKRCTSFFENF